MKLNPKENKVYFTKGTASKINHKGVKESVDSLPFSDPNCGCGIDCCYGIMVLPNYDSSTGEILNYFGAYFLDGVLTVDEINTVKSDIAALKQ